MDHFQLIYQNFLENCSVRGQPRLCSSERTLPPPPRPESRLKMIHLTFCRPCFHIQKQKSKNQAVILQLIYLKPVFFQSFYSIFVWVSCFGLRFSYFQGNDISGRRNWVRLRVWRNSDKWWNNTRWYIFHVKWGPKVISLNTSKLSLPTLYNLQKWPDRTISVST